MPQLGRLDYPVQDTAGNAVAGASVTVYREGATVNGNQSGSSPTTFTVRHQGKIVSGDTVFINTATGTSYSVTAASATSLTLAGYVGTLSLTNGDRIVPSNSLPTLYSDDRAGATIVNPLTSSNTGRAQCWLPFGAYDLIISGGGLTTQLYSSQVMPTESPAYGSEFYAESYGLTVSGIQQALDEAAIIGGGTVYVPATAGILVTDTSVKIPNRVRLVGTGAYGSTATFTANASTNVSAMVENKTQDGTQQYAYAEHISIDGNKISGAVVSAGLKFKSIYLGSRLKDVRVTACSGNGMLIDGGLSGVGLGQMLWDNLSVTSCNDHNILITGPVIQIVAMLLGVESVAAGKAQVKITNATASASFGHQFIGMKFEGNNAADGLWLDGVANVTVQGLSDHGNGTANNLVKITGSVTGSDGSFSSGGHLFLGLHANLTTIIDDQVSGVTVGNAQSRFVPIYICPKQTQSGGNDLFTGQIIGVQYQRQGINITAAATITPGNGNYFEVDGNTNITSVTATSRDKGRIITLMFNGTPTFTDGSNLKLSGNLVASADDTITLVCNGTNWYEIARSVN